MPFYEFYCSDCHTLFNFFSRRVDTAARPPCPRCERPLRKWVSMFAVSSGKSEADEPDLGGLDETKLEEAMMSLAAEADHVDEDDPRQIAHMVRKLYDKTGLRIGPAMDEAMQRMAAGEDPDQIEEEMGDLLENEDPFQLSGRGGMRELRNRLLPPKVDDTLYEL